MEIVSILTGVAICAALAFAGGFWLGVKCGSRWQFEELEKEVDKLAE